MTIKSANIPKSFFNRLFMTLMRNAFVGLYVEEI